MSRAARKPGPGGFTLIEVIIALFVIALGMGALLSTLVSAADNIGHLREKSFAEWIALNRLSEVRLGTRPKVGTTDGDTEYAGAKWHWRQQVTDPGQAGILRIDVAVARADATATAQPAQSAAAGNADTTFPALATAYGFVGTALAPANGFIPDWSPGPASGGQSGGAQGGGGQGGGGQGGSRGGGNGTPQS